MNLCFGVWLWRFILVNPLPFASNIFVTWNDILEKPIIRLPSKKARHSSYAIFFILMIKTMKKPDNQTAYISSLFQMAAD